jgi:hypothetical protein
MISVYLSGGIKGLTDEQAFGWRHKVCSHYGCTDEGRPLTRADGLPFILGPGSMTGKVNLTIPTRIEYRWNMDIKAAAEWIIRRDKMAIAKCDIVLVNAPVPSWGTAMEIMCAHELEKRIVVVCEDKNPSPWLVAHADILIPSFEDAYREIDNIVREMEELNL